MSGKLLALEVSGVFGASRSEISSEIRDRPQLDFLLGTATD